MAIRVVRLGGARGDGEGPRLGMVRRPPRGVKKDEIACRDFYDAWLPELAPSAELVKWIHEEQPVTDRRWGSFAKKYRREMATPERLLGLLFEHGAAIAPGDESGSP